ncbi:coiled-coil domain-containing protein 186 isoform X1 [Quercus lobata]|uniref:coiled-coil domain-containing protein 186 isoform X1 n=2 Tax=Quercus lobata TaxID=97700 RepID=UPI00124792BB|nr:coiled-coil domain-containing protein 186 isoform X1 [Quercus lobata]
MSWIRTAMTKAVEAGGGNNLTRTVRNYADSVVYHAGNAVSEGAKIIQDRIGPWNLKSFKHTLKQLEEMSVSCRGVERIQLLRRWLVALKEIERLSLGSNDHNEKNPEERLTFDDSKDSPRKPNMVYYVDSDMVGEPRNFRNVFLQSEALEGITLSMILEAPNEEEVPLLLEIYGLCLTGGKEVHNAIISSVCDLAKAFLGYQDEVLAKREELLQYAQGAVSGLKINADLERIDAEVSSLKEKLDIMKESHHSLIERSAKSHEEMTFSTVETIKEEIAQVQLCSKLEALLLRKKSLSNGDSQELHAEKVDKLKILSESLANSTSKAEKRILDHRSHKEEALLFRVAKSNEVNQLEKELVVEVGELEKQKGELEAALKKVNSSLAAAHARLRNVREERENFDEASNEILVHLKTKEDELLRSISSCRVEGNVVDTWIHFLDNTWVLQTSYTEQREKQVNGELKRYGEYFVNLVIHLLSAYKEMLGRSITRTRKLVDSLSSSQGSEILASAADESSKIAKPRKQLEEEYLEVEANFITTISSVDSIKMQLYIQNEGIFRKDNQKVKELFDALEKLKDEFESIGRPRLEIETPTQNQETPSSDRPHQSPHPTSKQSVGTLQNKQDKVNHSSSNKIVNPSDRVAEVAKKESEFGKVSGDDLANEIGEWEI